MQNALHEETRGTAIPDDTHESRTVENAAGKSPGGPRKPVRFVTGWGREERIALLLLIGVTIIVLTCHLVFSSIGKAPFATPFSETSRDGDLVRFSGTVGRVSHTQEGGHLILSVDGLQVFVPSTAAQGHTFRIGDAVSLYGTVQTFRGEREIVVQQGPDIWIDGNP